MSISNLKSPIVHDIIVKSIESSNLKLYSTNTIIDSILNEVDLSSNSPTALVTQYSIKTYVDQRISDTIDGVDEFIEMTDTPNVYTNSKSIYTVNDDSTGVKETDIQLTEGDNQFTITSGLTDLLVTADCLIDQDLSTTASPTFTSITTSATNVQTSSGDTGIVVNADYDQNGSGASRLWLSNDAQKYGLLMRVADGGHSYIQAYRQGSAIARNLYFGYDSFVSPPAIGEFPVETTKWFMEISGYYSKIQFNTSYGFRFTDGSSYYSPTITDILDEDDMASNSAAALCTQQSIKTYNDSFHDQTLNTTDSPTFANATISDTAPIFTVKGTDAATVVINASTNGGSSSEQPTWVMTDWVGSQAVMHYTSQSGHAQIHTYTTNIASPTNMYLGTRGVINTATPGTVPTVTTNPVYHINLDGVNLRTSINPARPLNFVGDTAYVAHIYDEDDMTSNSNTALATQQSIKAYVDSQIATPPNIFDQSLNTTDNVNFLSIQLEIGDAMNGVLNEDNMVHVSDTYFATSTSIKNYNDSFHDQTLNTTDNPTFANLTVGSDTISGNRLVNILGKANVSLWLQADTDGAAGTDRPALLTTDSNQQVGMQFDTVSANLGFRAMGDATHMWDLSFYSGGRWTINGTDTLPTVTDYGTLQMQILDATDTVNILNGLQVAGGTRISSILDEDEMTSDSATALCTQQSIKYYTDIKAKAAYGDTVTVTATFGVSIPATNLDIDIEFYGSQQYVQVHIPTLASVTAIANGSITATSAIPLAYRASGTRVIPIIIRIAGSFTQAIFRTDTAGNIYIDEVISGSTAGFDDFVVQYAI